MRPRSTPCRFEDALMELDSALVDVEHYLDLAYENLDEARPYANKRHQVARALYPAALLQQPLSVQTVTIGPYALGIEMLTYLII